MGKACPVVTLVAFVVTLSLVIKQKGKIGFALGYHDQEREALIKFKGSVIRDDANRFSSWKGANCCEWQGVACNNVTGHVLHLDLRTDLSPCDITTVSDGLRAQCEIAIHSRLGFRQLDPSLLKLRELRYLDLSSNDFNGSRIPEFIGLMKNLRYLNLSNTNFSGVVPPQLGNLTKLQYLDLSWDYSDVLITAYNLHWVSTLVKLKYLDISNIILTNEARNPVQALTPLTFLIHLRLPNLFLGISLSSLTFYNKTLASTIQHLDLSNSFWIEGPVPYFLANMSSLQFLDLSYNGLNGSIPLWLMNLQKLVYLDLAYNYFKGQIPHCLCNLTSIRSLHLSSNQLNGYIPLCLRNLKSLESLLLSANSFSHVEGWKIMGILGNLCNLKVLDLSNNLVLGGDILSPYNENFSECISFNLEYFDLTYNNVTSSLPYWLGQLKNLKILALGGGNRFYGPIPPSLGNLSLLEELDLGDCGLIGFIPSSLGALSSLKSLNLASNFLQGAMTDSHIMANLSSLMQLDISFNPLNLNFSFDNLPMFQLYELRMRSCRIKGKFPKWIKMQNELSVLDLSNNEISGKLTEWTPGVNLYHLNLSHNHIIGPIPHFPSYSSLSSIDLSYNSFSGHILNDSFVNKDLDNTSLCILWNLKLLDLKNNQLSGTIPDCWGRSNYTRVIDLSSNNLSGIIPTTFGHLLELAYLKLNNNALQGEIPPTLQVSSGLRILDLGENRLTGTVPNWDGESHSYLTILRLRGNQFEGVIPPQLCTLPSLQILDLANNNLTGSIPLCSGNLISMKSTHLSESFAISPALAPAPAGDNEPTKNSQEENAMVVLKGEELQYTTTLKFVVDLDLSCNALVGSIPEELTKLLGLIGLNLSYNHLTGGIPEKIGEMTSLESLDLSNNNLSGTIPSSMASLFSLSSLNLSYNKFHGEIPTENQFHTFNDPSAYVGNAGLCGDPLPNTCGSKHGNQLPQEEDEDEDDDNLEKALFYIVIMLGFATGFWGVVGSLLLNKTWRHAVFRHADKVTDFLYVQVVVRIKKLRT